LIIRIKENTVEDANKAIFKDKINKIMRFMIVKEKRTNKINRNE